MTMTLTPNRSALFDKLKTIKPKAITAAGPDLIHETFFSPGQTLPLVVTPKVSGLQLAEWAAQNYGWIISRLEQYGGILFRGFGGGTQTDFEQFVRSIPMSVMEYMEGATPRTKLSKDVYTSTEFPADQSIALHNELSYVKTWPAKIIFYCVTAAKERGETPIANTQNVFEKLDPSIRQKFIDKGWMLIRNYGEGMGLSWQRSFHTESKAELEAYLREADVHFEWRANDVLRTFHVRPAVLRHPTTKAMIWFNHIAFWNVRSLPPAVREPLLALYREDELAYNTYYGDGSPIEPAIIDEINRIYDQETVSFPWQQGDLLFLDNMRVAHARSPFVGPRRILTAMGDATGDRGL
jgi:alpha-ketoglutarate-dependent taurine dioxygenase